MADYLPKCEFRKVMCVDPCDPSGQKVRRINLLVHNEPFPKRNAGVDIVRPFPQGWNPEPKLVTPVRLVDSIEEDTIIREIHVVDPVFGNQLLQYITAQGPIKPGMELENVDIVSEDPNVVSALWTKALRAPDYDRDSKGPDAAGNFDLPKDQIYFGGARTEFAASYNNKYPVLEEVPADDIPTYCDCQVKADNNTDRGEMIQCANGERWCLKEWYHLGCIGMVKEEVPYGDWYCRDCAKDRIGTLKAVNYVPWEREELKATSKGIQTSRRKKGKKEAKMICEPEAKIAAD